MINEFKEWKSLQDPFTSDDVFFTQKYPGLLEVPATLKDIFKELHDQHHKMCQLVDIIVKIDERLDEIEE